MEEAAPTTWTRALLALDLLTADPGLGGMVVRARAGPVRDAFLAKLALALPTARKLHAGIDDEQLFGGIDMTATLAEGRLVRSTGLIDRTDALILTMAERAPPALSGRLAMHLDGNDARPLIALDEGSNVDETVPQALADRLAFWVDLTDIARTDLTTGHEIDARIDPASCRPVATFDQMEQIVTVALALGIASPRAACLALRAAQAHAMMQGRAQLTGPDIEAAVALVLVPRATQIPDAPDGHDAADDTGQSEAAPSPDAPNDATERPPDPDAMSDDMLIGAARALLPPNLLDRLRTSRMARGTGAGSGDRRHGNHRGRPLPARPGRIGGQNRIDLVATLRAAAPWQPLRRRSQPDRPGVLIRPSDIHIRRTEETSDRLLIFVVDASGSAARTRLAEAKGAVEMMLAAAYAKRDHVALVSFRGTAAEVLLQPTRSLLRTKRQLAALPGGGATPLAAGLMAAMTMARAARARGMSPTIALLTDGRANIALDGSPDRTLARENAETVAHALRAMATPAVVIDLGQRPEAALSRLAHTMGGTYLALPRADAGRISGAVGAALGT